MVGVLSLDFNEVFEDENFDSRIESLDLDRGFISPVGVVSPPEGEVFDGDDLRALLEFLC